MAASLAQVPKPVSQLATIARISPDLIQSPVVRFQREQYDLGSISILDVRRMDPHFEHQA